MFLDLISLIVLCIFCLGMREIKCENNIYLPLILTEVDNRRLMNVTLGGQSIEFWTTNKQSSNGPNHR